MTGSSAILSTQDGLANQAASLAARVTGAIKNASQRVGVDFAYLLKKAEQESSLNPTAKAATSTARGLFQFVEQTWLRMVKAHGDKYGLAQAANSIHIGSDGVARVSDASAKKQILSLRDDPSLSACMAAELTNENKTALQNEVGGTIGSTELYLAHFLGAGGAGDFLAAMRQNPNASAASVLPQAAGANPSVFYAKDGSVRSLKDVYQHFAAKFDGTTKNPCVAPVAVASAAPVVHSALNFTVDQEDTATATRYPYSSSGLGFSSNILNSNSLSSPMATMMLAQMDMGHLDHLASSRDDQNKDKKQDNLFRPLTLNG